MAKNHFGLNLVGLRKIVHALEGLTRQVAVMLKVVTVTLSLDGSPCLDLSHTGSVQRPSWEARREHRKLLLLVLDQV